MVTGWNLLSSAASFPMVLRYSSAVIHQTRDDRDLATMTGKDKRSKSGGREVFTGWGTDMW